ncbi:acyl-CoA thioesterase [Bacillus pinisoli]|uniref:acyl-CoA thioesterase n=1 Tax=Bacillus pinisoli TaxID=2901866 RepID=UPI001FF6B0AF|nr:thioesterase family protein [Bacillus pinisoli]
MLKTIIRPRVSETDGAGHINNTTLPVWFEAGREEIFEMFTPDHSFKNWRCVILNSNIDYLNQIYYGKEVEVQTWVSKIGNTSFTLYEELYQDGKLCARSKAVYVNFNFEKQSKEFIPDSIRIRLKQHQLTEQ